jgi:OOP family OmpA-OmpF porin
MDFRFSQFEVMTTAGSFFVSLLFVCVFVEASDIEQEVGIAAAEVANSQNLFWAAVEPSGLDIVLSGAAPDEAARARVGDLVARVSGVETVDNRIEVVGDLGGCQLEIDRLLGDSRITFKRGKAELLDASYPTLVRLAGIARRCNGRLEVASHTDAEGDAGINLKLSQRRADAVRKYLVQRGVHPRALDATGYGETQPIADNGTKSGRKTNQRVEIRVLGGPV